MRAADPRAEERVGSVLHEKWTLERLIGVGGMGAVYAARHRNGARAAVKVLSPSSGRLPHIRDRFLREGYAANRVEHPGVVRVLDDDVINDGADEGTAYLVMELLEGESLQQRAKREPPLCERDLLEIADGVLAVLEAAHAKGVVHRDLKPDNLFLARDAERGGVHVKVLDFGLARLLETQEQTIAGMAIGTPTYMSPEQAAGHVDEIDGRTDIYALGCILFQLLSNRRVHDAAHTLGLVVRMATTPAPKLVTVAPEVSEEVSRIVDRALEFKREDRYRDAAAMRADVKAAIARRASVEASTVHVLSASSPPPDAPAAAIAPTVAAAAPSSPHVQPARSLAAESEDEPAGRSEADEPARRLDEVEPAARDGRLARTIVVFGVAALAWLLAWSNWSSIERVVFSGASPTENESPPPEPSVEGALEPESDPDLDASIATDDDPSAGAMADDLDLDADDPDASDVDGGDDDDDDEEEEEEELDAAVEASAPTSRPGTWSPPRRVVRPPAAKPTKKKPKPPRRPGQPRRKKRKRRWR